MFFCGEIDQKGSNFQSTIFEPLDSMLDIRLLVGWLQNFSCFHFFTALKALPKGLFD